MSVSTCCFRKKKEATAIEGTFSEEDKIVKTYNVDGRVVSVPTNGIYIQKGRKAIKH